MNKTITKSLIIGSLALGIGISLQANSAQAATKFVYNHQLTTSAASRNVVFTTKNALYNKAGVLNGAKVVASKARLASISDITENKLARAYRIAKTNTGSIYYKVVTYSGYYRGWIYGGKVANQFGGGLAHYATTSTYPTPTSSTKFQVPNLADATRNDVFWTAPANSTYKAARATINDISQYQNATFTVSKAVKVTATGDVWYRVASTDSALDGTWVTKDDVTTVK